MFELCVVSPIARAPLLLSLALATTACASSARWLPLDRPHLPTQPDANAQALVLDDETHVVFALERGQVVADKTTVRRVLVFDERGAEYARAGVAYSSAFQEVVSARSRRVRADGTIDKLERAKMVDALANQGALHNDYRTLMASFDDIRAGDVVEHHFVVRHKRPDLFSFINTFEEAIPVKRAVFSVRTPVGWELQHVVTRGSVPEAWDPAVHTNKDGTGELEWVAQDLPALPDEPLAPSHFDRARMVALRLARWSADDQARTSFADEQALAKWVHEIQPDTRAPSAEVVAQTEAVLRGVPPDPRARAEALYNWVQGNVRYVAISVGIGGWAAHDYRDVLSNKYGDCKDKAVLLQAMLRVAGIDSRMAILNAHDGTPRVRHLPVIGFDNHAILAIDLPDGTVLVDPTTRSTPFGELPPSDQGTRVLLVSERGGEVVTTPEAPVGAHARHIELTLDARRPDLELHGELRVTARGTYGDQLFAAAHDATEQTQTMLQQLARLVGGRVEGLVPLSTTKTGTTTRRQMGGKVVMPTPLTTSGQTRVLRLDKLIDAPRPEIGSGPRTTPVVLRATNEQAWVVSLTLPPGARARLPAQTDLTHELGSYRVAWSQEGDVVTARVTLRLAQRHVPAARAHELRKLYDDLAIAVATPVIITSTENK